MKLETKEAIENFIKENCSLINKYLSWSIALDEASDIEEFIEQLEKEVYYCEIIYYANALEFLMEYDAGLQEACKIAYELGYETKDLNSELLATLLLQEIIREEIAELRGFLENLELEDEEEEEV